jgi:hypothetical protein
VGARVDSGKLSTLALNSFAAIVGQRVVPVLIVTSFAAADDHRLSFFPARPRRREGRREGGVWDSRCRLALAFFYRARGGAVGREGVRWGGGLRR